MRGDPLRVAVVGVGKMGLSHLSLLRAHPQVELAAMCDSNKYVLDTLAKYTGIPAVKDYQQLVQRSDVDAVVIATPTTSHFAMAMAALESGKHVFCEKPLTLKAADSQILTKVARDHGLVTQVGYHNRFVATFAEVARLVSLGAIGTISHAQAEAYGPVVLRPKGGTWRSRRDQGGGCMYDYAAHPLDLLTWYLGTPESVSGTVLSRIFSVDTEDAVYSTLDYGNGCSAQLSVNWSDESYRKMSTKITLWGSAGRIVADRQECQVYLREDAEVPEGYRIGWNVRYTTDLTDPVWFYVRGEEYSAELDYFVRSALSDPTHTRPAGLNDFESAQVADEVIEMLLADAESDASTRAPRTPVVKGPDSTARARSEWPARLGQRLLGMWRSRRRSGPRRRRGGAR